jgi:2-hydroxychromene-2-carboxylate isomerase
VLFRSEAPEAIAAIAAALVRAVWYDGQDPDDPAVIMPLAHAHGLDHLALRAAGGEGEAQLAANLAEAEAADVFGVPSLVLGVERDVYFGEDRLELARARAR